MSWKSATIGSCHIGAYIYTLRSISCGRANCGACPHGPYWYVEGPNGRGGRFKRYLGKTTPAEVASYQQRLNLFVG